MRRARQLSAANFFGVGTTTKLLARAKNVRWLALYETARMVYGHGKRAWDKLEPMYFKVYRDTFTQEEVDGMLKFYKTAAGKAMITKMPMVMQRTMTEMQQMMGPIAQRLQKMETESIEELKATPAK